MKKDIKWMLSSTEYVVKNVPVIELDGEEFFDTNTSIVLLTMRDLMVENEIPKEVDFDKFKHIKF